MNKRKIKDILIDFLHDGVIGILFGIVAAVGLGIVIALIAGLISGFDGYTMLNAVRSGLLIVGALCLFVVAGVMLGQKSNDKIRSSNKWKDTFYVLGPPTVFLLISIAILMIATIVDYIVWSL